MSFRLLEAPTLMLVAIARRLRSYFGYGYSGKTVKPKNPNRVAGGKKAAETRRLNKALAKVNAGATVVNNPGTAAITNEAGDFDEDAIRNAGYAQ